MKNLIIESITNFLNEYDETNSNILYHGTDNKFTVFNDNKPIFFVDNIDVAKTYGRFIIKAKLKMNNPIELDFDGNSTYFFFDKWYLPSDLANKIKEIADDIQNYISLDDDLKEYLEYLGLNFYHDNLDGIIMKNISDAMNGMFSTHKPANNYVAFNKNQINVLN